MKILPPVDLHWGARMIDIGVFLIPAEELPYLKCPLHTVLKLTPVAYGKTPFLTNLDIIL